MRKFIIFGIFMLGLFVSSVSFAKVDTDFEVAVVTIYGDVSVDAAGTGNFVPATEGMKLKQGAILRTGFKSLADLVFDFEGLNVVSIKEDSTVIIRSDNVDLPDGAVLVKFDNLKNGQGFSVKTPTATCGIRGSGMGVTYRRGKTNVRAFHDTVYVQGLDSNGNPVGGEQELPEGNQGDIGGDGNMGEQSELTGEDNEEWQEFSGQEGGSEEENEDLANFEDEQQTDDGEVDTKDLSEQRQISPR